MRSIAFAIIFSVMASAVSAQTVCGTLVDDSARPVKNATIALISPADSSAVRDAVSNDMGVFCIACDSLPCLLRVTALGHKTAYSTVDGTDYPLRIHLGGQPALRDPKQSNRKTRVRTIIPL